MKYSFRRFISLVPTSLVALLTRSVSFPLGGSPQISQGLKSGQAVKSRHMLLVVTTILWFLIALSASLTMAATIELAKKKPPQPLGPVTCSQLAADPALGLA